MLKLVALNCVIHGLFSFDLEINEQMEKLCSDMLSGKSGAFCNVS